LTVEEASAAGVRLRLEGFVQSESSYEKYVADPAKEKGSELTFSGVLNYDAT
jgi:hypothetical protein